MAQQITIRGTIKSRTSGEPLPGVTVSAAGTNSAKTVSDEKGNYRFAVTGADNIRLEFSLIGFKIHTDSFSIKNKSEAEYNVLLTEDEEFLLGVEIQESKTNQRGEQGQTTEIVTQEQIDRQAATNLKPGLQMVTGVTILDNQINIRGSSGFNYGTGSRVLVLLNGMPAMNAERATVNFNLLPSDNIDRVEVIKGSASLRFGSSALGGVVNVVMDKPADTAQTTIRFAQRFYLPPGSSAENWEGTKQSYVSSLHFSQSQRIRDSWNFTVQGDLVRDAGYRNEEYNNRIRALLLNEWRDAFRKRGLNLGLNVQYLGERSAVFVFWEKYPGFTHEPGLNSLSSQTLNYLFIDPSVKYISAKGNIYRLQSRVSLQKTVSSTGLSGYSLLNWNELTWSREFKPWLSFIAGVNYQYSHSEPESSLQGKASGHQTGQFIIGTFRFVKSKFKESEYRLTLTAGMRFQYERMTGDTLQTDNEFQSVALTTLHHPLAGLTLNYHLFRFTHLRASISQGVRAASLNERFSNLSLGGLRTNPAPDIRPETGFSTELGITQYFGVKGARSQFSGYMDAAGFLMRFQDMIEFLIDIPKSSLTQLSFKAQNLTDVSIAGLEGNVGLKYEVGKFFISCNAGTTLLQAVNHDGLKELDGDSATVLVLNPPVPMTHPDFYKYVRDIPYTLKYRSRLSSTQSLTVGWSFINLTTNYRYLSRMINVDKLLLFAIPGTYAFRKDHAGGWYLLDFILAATIKKQHTLSFHLFNVLNMQYMILPGNIGEQRSVAMQYKVVF